MSTSQLARLFGRPTIPPLLFFAAKLGFLASLVYLVVELAGAGTGLRVAPALRALAVALLAAGSLLVSGAIATLGPHARVGLPKEETRLRTDGLYRFSRNPIYLGAYLICAASVLYSPHWLPIVSGGVASALHHRIVLAEERFLAARFGAEWEAYRARVRRYL